MGNAKSNDLKCFTQFQIAMDGFPYSFEPVLDKKNLKDYFKVLYHISTGTVGQKASASTL